MGFDIDGRYGGGRKEPRVLDGVHVKMLRDMYIELVAQLILEIGSIRTLEIVDKAKEAIKRRKERDAKS